MTVATAQLCSHATPRESAIVQAVLRYINALPNSHAEKTHGTAYGMPRVDIDASVQGRAVKLEVKRPGQKPTPRQLLALRRWAAAGAITGVVTNVDEARALIGDKL